MPILTFGRKTELVLINAEYLMTDKCSIMKAMKAYMLFLVPRSDQKCTSCLYFLSFKWKWAWHWTSVFGLSNWQVCPSTAAWRRTVRRWPTLMRWVFSFPLSYTHTGYDGSANTSPLTPLSCDKQAAGQYLPNIRRSFLYFNRAPYSQGAWL